jgi:cell division protein FtsI (penicillin-binding protein 3)
VDNHAVLKGHEVPVNRMPDLRGMGLKDAVFLLESMQMKVSAKGKGKIKQQSINPGTGINKNQKVTLELN